MTASLKDTAPAKPGTPAGVQRSDASVDDCITRIALFAARDPGAPAVCMPGRTWTYGELWHAVESISRLIIATGTDAHRPVALVMDKDGPLIASMIAVVYSGRFFVAVDPDYPKARNKLVLQDANPSLILHDGHEPGSPPPDAVVLGLAAMNELIVPDPGRLDMSNAPDDDRLACLVYTSGSTGRPKGVMVPRGALDQIARIQGSHIGIRPGTRMSMLSSASVFGGMRTIWGGLSSGAVVCPFVIEKEGLGRIGEWLESERIEILHCTPSVVRHFSKSLSVAARFPLVRTVIYGADRVLSEDVAVARSVFAQDVQVWTGLGASESGTVTGRMIPAAEALPEGPMPLGPTVPGRVMVLLDAQDEPVRGGATGEMVVEGPGLALGYWRQPERTATAFARSATSGWRRFRTGDLARSMPDGSLLHMGRKDFVVKVRGVRVDLGEIEVIVARHEAVRECAVIAVTAGDDEVLLVAFVQFTGDEAVQAVRDHVASALPLAMQPQRYVIVQDWPRTMSGKLDRLALRLPEVSQDDTSDLLEGLEQVVGGIWSEVLGSTVRRHDTNFFEAGGNSLSAMRVAARVASTCGRRIPPTALFATPRLRDFVAIVEASPAPTDTGTFKLANANGSPLSPAQEALWFLEKLDGKSATYNISLPLRLTGPLDHGRLARALEQLRQRHEALRIMIREVDGRPIQQILPTSASAPMTARPLIAEPVAGERLNQLIHDEVQHPVAISAAQLWRARLLQIGPHDHVLILVLHHVICDGWSLQLLAEDLSELYSSGPAAIATGQTGFIEVVSMQRALALSEVGAASRVYWSTQLAGLPNLELPTDRPVAGFASSAGAIEKFSIPRPVNKALRALALHEQATPFMVQLAGYQLLLARLSGSMDFGIGIPVADRPASELERVVGYLVNTLVLRAPLTDNMTFRELLGQVRQAVVEALAHQDFALERLVEELAPIRDGNRNPLFQVAFATQNQPRGQMRFAGLEARGLDTHNGASKFHLTLEVSDSTGDAWGEFEYRTELFDRSTISRMAGQYVRLLQAALEAPDVPALSLPILGPEERDQLLRGWNATSVPRRKARLDEIILEQCARTPDAPAIVGLQDTVTYAVLATDVESSALALRANGVSPGDPVGVLMRRSPGLIVSALAIMRAGGVYLPLDPDWPEQRCLSVAQAAGAKLILGDERIQTVPDSASPQQAPITDPPAYILFTSGSTGAPKGVEISHASICNHLLWFNDCTEMAAADAMLFKTAPTFDASLVEMFAPLLAGARIVILKDQGELDPAFIVRAVQQNPITVLQGVPSAFRALLEVPGISECAALRYLVIGGDTLDAGLAQTLKRKLPAARIGNFYGPTEVTIDATQHEVTDKDTSAIPIGRPIANARCYVLDSRCQPQPVGVWGELYVSGMGVAQGYRNRPDLTAASFLPDPFLAGERMYRTGDRVRWRTDGTLEFSGRRDGQIKIRGLRVELGEIEARLLAQRGVASAVVMPLGGGESSVTRLVAFVVAKSGVTLDAVSLKDALAIHLPRYMLPNRIVFREELPLLRSGKVDRAALVGELDIARKPKRSFPRTALERKLLRIWRRNLRVKRAGIDDDFFELGGHSLLAFQVVSQIQQRLERACTLRMLFRFPTVRQLAQALEADSKAAQGSIVLPLQTNGNRPPIYCICGVQLYRELAQHFAPDVPVHGVFLPWEEQILEGSRQPEGLAVSEMAAGYIRAIRAVQPQGTFSLVGISFGGILAFEIARQLAAAGVIPPLVAVLDMPPVEERRSPRFSPKYYWGQIALWARSRFNRMVAKGLDPEALRIHLAEERGMMYGKAMRAYRTLPYEGRLLVVRATRRHRGGAGADPALGWRRYVANVTAIDAPGDHLGILRKEGARIIARSIRPWLP